MTGDIQSAGSAHDAAFAAIRRASAATGAGFDYLMKTAMRESSLNANAKAATSSAAGLFQFIEQTWLGAVKTYGARHGLGAEAGDITKDANGRFVVADAARRTEILNLRFDANAASALAGELTQENARILRTGLGRAATAADLYAAHFLGPAGAVKLLSSAAHVKAADILPAAAKANGPVFYDGARAKTVGEILSSFTASVGERMTPAAVSPSIAAEKPPAPHQAHAAYSVETSAPSAPTPMAPPRLSLLAMSILQALDPSWASVSSREDNR